MEADIDLVKGSFVVGFSFPNPMNFQLQCMNFYLLRDHNIAMLDLLFSGMSDTRIVNAGKLIESKVTAILSTEGSPLQFRFELVNGFIEVDCAELHIRKIMLR